MTRTICGLPARLALYIAAVAALGLPLVVLALARIALEPPAWGTALPVGLFFALALIAELRPVPMDIAGWSETTITNVFMVAVAVLFGWRYAVPLAAVSVGASMIVGRRPVERVVFNTSMYALSAAMASLPALVFGPAAGKGRPGVIVLYVVVGSLLHLVANVVIVSRAISLSERIPYWAVAGSGLRGGGPSFGIMSALAGLAASLWVLDSWLLLLLAGPLFTLTLYQRSTLHQQIAARDARTDHLTGLGNHRAYQAALRDKIVETERTGRPFSLCLIDIDNFKHVNDTYGHPVGDALLLQFASLLTQIEEGEAFRFGGDELAVLVSADEVSAYRELERIQRELALIEASPEGPVTISAGIASFPTHADDADQLQRTADGALYWAKGHGKNRACLYSPSVVRILTPEEIERETERNARLRAAKNLVRFLDARDASTATHSEVVASLAEAIGLELGLEPAIVENLRLAGLLHDLGKIGIPDSILRAPRSLTPEEYEVVKRHAEFGYSLLDGLGIEPVDLWVLHHHENWDGTGYPHGLAGEEIPLGARVLHVADTFEAITADRPYRNARSQQWALAELRRHAGTQFDPAAVEALERSLAACEVEPEAALA